MAVVNVNPDSFSDPHPPDRAPPDAVTAGLAAVAAGAAVVDVGAESAALAAARVPVGTQVDLLRPVVAALAAADVVVSVDTYLPAVARAALEAGAHIVNDYSGRADPDLLGAVAGAGACYVLTHNPLGPRRRQSDPAAYGDVVDDVSAWFDDRIGDVVSAGVPQERVVLDPGVDIAKTPRQTLRLLRGAGLLRARFDLPLLWAVSRKDVLGVLLQRPPQGRGAATAAVVAWLAGHPDTLLRVHDVTAAADVLAVTAALRGDRDLAATDRLADGLRRESAAVGRGLRDAGSPGPT